MGLLHMEVVDQRAITAKGAQKGSQQISQLALGNQNHVSISAFDQILNESRIIVDGQKGAQRKYVRCQALKLMPPRVTHIAHSYNGHFVTMMGLQLADHVEVELIRPAQFHMRKNAEHPLQPVFLRQEVAERWSKIRHRIRVCRSRPNARYPTAVKIAEARTHSPAEFFLSFVAIPI